MAQTKQRNKSRKIEVDEYTGGNERLDVLRLHFPPTERLFMVNGYWGRKPIIADSGEEAVEIYHERFGDEGDDQ